jgi:hypothetical protein
MATTKAQRPTSAVLQDIDELEGWITVKKAAEIVGMKVESLSAKIYQQKFKAVRIAGIILCEKKSVEEYAAARAETGMAQLPWNKVSKMLENLSPEDREKVLAQLNGK